MNDHEMITPSDSEAELELVADGDSNAEEKTSAASADSSESSLESELVLAQALDSNLSDDSLIGADADANANAEAEIEDRDASSSPSNGEAETLAVAPTQPVADFDKALAAARASLESRLDKLSSQFDREVRAETTRERVVDRLHAELQEYKNDLLLKTLRPIFIDLIQLHDDIGKMAEPFRAEAASEENPAASRAVGVLENVQQGIEDTLYRQGVEPFPDVTKPGSTFDARRQRAVATVATDEADLAKKVAARLRKGFQAGDKVIRPEIVSVYSLKSS